MQELKRLMGEYAKAERKWFICGFLGGIFRFVVPLMIPLILKYLVDDVIGNGGLTGQEKTEKIVWLAGGVFFVFVVLRGPFEYLRIYALSKAQNNIVKKLRFQAFSKTHDLDASYFASTKSGEIASRVFEDIEKVKNVLNAAFVGLWLDLLVMGFVMATIFSLNVKLALVSICLLPVQFLAIRYFAVRFKGNAERTMSYESVLKGFLVESIQGSLTAKQFGTEEKERQAFDQHLRTHDGLVEEHGKLVSISRMVINVLSDLTPFIVVFVAAVMVLNGETTIGTLMAFFSYIERMKHPIERLIDIFPTLSKGTAALRRVFAFLDTEPRMKDGDATLAAFERSIDFCDVSFGYTADQLVLQHLSLRFEKGKTYALVGESGGGKSTVTQLLTRLYDATAGDVQIDGQNIQSYQLASIKRAIGIVTQETFLYSFSIKDNIKIGKLDATDEEVEAAARKAFAHDFIQALPNGYHTEVGERGVKLSGGQKQRIALARVFLKDPSIIVMDEATSALDNESERLVQQSLRKYAAGKTVIMVAHRLSTVEHADTILVMKKGRIVESGTHRELVVQNGVYRDLQRASEQTG